MVSIIDPEQDDKELRHTVPTVQATSKQPAEMDEQANTANTNENWRDAIGIPSE